MHKKKKIIFVVTKSGWGGAQKSVFLLARYFHDTGKYDVAVAYGTNWLKGGNILEDKLKEAGVRTLPLTPLKRDVAFLGDVRSFFTLLKLFREERPDVVHLNSSKAGALGAPAARLAGVHSIVFTMRGAPFLEIRPRWQNMIIEFLTWVTAVFSHTFVAVSKREREIILEWPFTKKKITDIYNSVESPGFLSRADARAYIGKLAGIEIPEDIFLIGSIGELTDNKGLLEFLPKLKERKEKQDFLYIHFGSGELAEQLKEKTRELNLESRVHWLGFVSDASKYIKALDLFTLPSKKEGFPNVLLEAKLAGIPIEASSVGGIPELLKMSEEYVRTELTPAKVGESYRSVYGV